MISKQDEKLIRAAERLLDERYARSVHTVASAIRTTDGQVFTAINSNHFLNFVCAETAVLDKIINDGRYDVDTVVAMKIYGNDGTKHVVNPCGKCRQILYDYAPNSKFIIHDGKELSVKTISELLPFAFKRQQEKIQEAIGGEK